MADMTEKDGQVNPEEEIIIVEDKSLLTKGVDDDDDDDHEEDDRTPQTPDEDDDEDREAIRERRRKEKLERKDRKDQAIKRDKTELDFLRSRNDDLERRLTAQEQRAHKGDLNAFDVAIGQAAQEADMADKVIAKAVESGNGEDVTQAMRYRDQAMAKIQQLQYQKQQATQAPPQQAPQIDDRTMRHAQDFMKKNSWYDAQGRDEDSAIVMAIDQALAKDGYDPKTDEYWAELEKRAARRLPERFEPKDKPPKERIARGGPAVGSGREFAPGSTRTEFYLSPDRKAALIDSGVWDDPILRAKYVKRYAEYDKAQSKK
jgi:hypothetical protein